MKNKNNDKTNLAKILTQDELMELADEEIKKYDKIVNEFSTQLKSLKADLDDEDKIINEKVKGELDAFPDSSPKGLLEKVFKLSLPKRGQLQENISKVDIALQHAMSERNKAIRGKQGLEAKAKEELLGKLREKVCEDLKSTLNRYIDFEDSFHDLKQKVSELALSDKMFFNKINIEKYPRFYIEVLGLSLMSPGSLPQLTPLLFINQISSIGKDTENPLKTDRRFSREDGKHLFEQGSPGHKAFEIPATDKAIEDKIGEVWESGPTIPTVHE